MGEFRLEVGKKYVDRRGRVYGPMVATNSGRWFGEDIGLSVWLSTGGVINHSGCEATLDLIAEYVEPAPVEYRMLQDGETIQAGDEWKANGGWTNEGVSVGKKFTPSLYVPHRRKVEPPATVAPATLPVRLWVSERITYESGDWPVRCGVEPPSGLGSWSEIFPSPDGFFVKKQP